MVLPALNPFLFTHAVSCFVGFFYIKGGLVFLIAWVLFLVLWSSPMLLIEYGTGRYTRKAVIGSFRHIIGDGATWCGAWITMVTFLISLVVNTSISLKMCTWF